MTVAKVCEGGSRFGPPGGSQGGAEVAVCEGIMVTSQPGDRSTPVSPRYHVKSRDILIGCLETSLFLGWVAVALGHAACAGCSFSGSGFESAGLAVFVGVEV